MKKLLLASAVAALSVTAAQAAPTVYGKVFLTVDVQDGDGEFDNKRTQLNSIASRIGVKGSEALTDETDVVYKLEYRLQTDHETGPSDRNFEARDTYLGVANKKFGTLVAGRLTTIDDYVNYANVTKGGVVGGDNVMTAVDAPRANNAFAYFSPEYSGVQFMGMYALDEVKAGSNIGQDNVFGRDAWGVGVKYEPSTMPLKAGATYMQAGDSKAVRASAAYGVTPALTVGGLYQFTELEGAPKKENALAISGKYKVGQTPWTAYSQLDLVDNARGTDNAELQRLVVGTLYNFNPNTIGHLYGGYMKSEVNNVDLDAYGVGAGIEYKF